MTIAHARVIKASALPVPGPLAAIETRPDRRPAADPSHARRVAAEVVLARAEAARILEEARGEAAALVAGAAEQAGREAREGELARLAALALALREEENQRAERDVERTIAVATLLAERLVGEALAVSPARIADLATAALSEARGARRIRIEAAPADVDALAAVLEAVPTAAEVVADPELARGSLVVHTELGKVDARLTPQIDRLATALRETLARERLQEKA